jgi:phage RecT family recombinase
MERETKTQPAITVLRDRLLQRRAELEHALEGSGISPDRFIRVAVTAAMMQPELISDVSFQSLWQALLEACNDRLLPDRRQGVILPYKGKAKWQRMYHGMIDRFQQSGEFKWIGAGLHREDDREFDVWLDEHGQHFLHRPGPGNGKVVESYAAALTKGGGFFVTTINETEMQKIRNVSRARGEDSPWQQWTDQMRLKTALKRLCNLLPVPQGLDTLVRDEGDDAGETPATGYTLPTPKPPARPRGAQNALDHFGGEPDDGAGEPDTRPPPTAKGDRFYREPEPTPETDKPEPKTVDTVDQSTGEITSHAEIPQVRLDVAHERGVEAKRTGLKRTTPPGEYREANREGELRAWLKGWDGEPLGSG